MPQKINPDAADFRAIESELGVLMGGEADETLAERYRLAQAHKALRMGWAACDAKTGHFDVTAAGRAALA